MTISELMSQLSKVVEQFGDVEVLQYNREFGEFHKLSHMFLTDNYLTKEVTGVSLSFNVNEILKDTDYSDKTHLVN